MKPLAALAITLFLSGSLLAQYRGNFSGTANAPGQNVITGSVPGVVFPGGTPGAHPGVAGGQRSYNYNFNNNGYGAGNNFNRGARRNENGSYVYAYPVYVGSYGSTYDAGAYGPAGQTPQQPNVTIIMPPQQPPVIINQYDSAPRPQMSVYQPEPAPAVQPDESAAEPAHYLLAFKDHTIYSAIAYWVDGDTLHYFTAGNTHNQVSVSLIDRPLTDRLNKDAGVEVKLPAAK